jgi:hypothetical protein
VYYELGEGFITDAEMVLKFGSDFRYDLEGLEVIHGVMKSREEGDGLS